LKTIEFLKTKVGISSCSSLTFPHHTTDDPGKVFPHRAFSYLLRNDPYQPCDEILRSFVIWEMLAESNAINYLTCQYETWTPVMKDLLRLVCALPWCDIQLVQISSRPQSMIARLRPANIIFHRPRQGLTA
jgi:hypothetical protein